MTTPASTCFKCTRQGLVSPDQGRATTTKGTPLSGIRFYCACGHEWAIDREQAMLQGRFLDKARLRNYTPEPIEAVQVAVLDALDDAIDTKTTPLRDWRLRELADVSLQLQGQLAPADRKQLLQRWADLTLLIGTP